MTTALSSTSDREYLVVDVGGAMVALAMQFVQEIVRAVAVTPLPAAPNWVSGVINVRGRTIVVIDLRVRLLEQDARIRSNNNMVLVEYDGIEFALVVDSALEVTRLERPLGTQEHLDTENNTESQFGVRSSMVAMSSNTFGHRSLMILDLENLVTDCRQYFVFSSKVDGLE